ncbi:hypothetical protein ACFYUD_34085 [Nocardia tengchongensis]|uniref:hypothetical protein n=1 Tax=Nocardia tengchongensis TaxID=2055889 RepID=UPI00367B5B98
MAPIWRNRDLEQVAGGPLEARHLTEDGILKLVETYPAETEYVEYKAKGLFLSFNGSKDWTPAQERAKDVCAPANGRGAVIVIGVQADATAAAADRLKPFLPSDGDRDQLMSDYKDQVRVHATPIPLYDMFAVDWD